MADILRIKRRLTGSPGAPTSLANAELAYNEVDHILYYGEGTGGAGGTATVVVPIGGTGQASNATPVIDGTAAAGSSALYSRGDHVHPTDTSRYAASNPSGFQTAANITTSLTPYALLASPTFTGTPTLPTGTVAVTQTAGNSTVAVATTAFVQAALPTAYTTPLPAMDGTAANGSATQWARGDHVHPTDTSRYAAANPSGYQTAANVTTSLTPYALLASPVFSGTPSLPTGTTGITQTSGNNTTALATTAFVQNAVPTPYTTPTPAMDGTASNGSATQWARGDHVHPTDTSRYAAANPSGYQTAANVTASLTPYALLASPVFTGSPSAPTAANGTNTTQLATTAYAMGVRQDQQPPPTAAVSWNNQFLQNLLDPLNPQDAATKHYVDLSATGLQSKAAVIVATTANLTLSGAQTVDGVAVIANDRVLVKDQTLQQNNGIYTVAAGAWTRATDMDTWSEVPQAYVFVAGGTVNINSSWTCSSVAGGTIGTTAVTWVQFSQSATTSAGNGMSKVGNTFNVVGTTNRIVVGSAVDIAATYVGQTSLTTLGTVSAGTWAATTIGVAFGGTGAGTLTGYIKGAGTSAFTASATIPSTDISGLGSMSTQAATAVAITGGTIDNVTLDCGTF